VLSNNRALDDKKGKYRRANGLTLWQSSEVDPVTWCNAPDPSVDEVEVGNSADVFVPKSAAARLAGATWAFALDVFAVFKPPEINSATWNENE
jgi:hypothetical protein